MSQALVYSYKDFVFTLSHPTAGIFIGKGQVGAGKLTISKTTTRAEHLVSADGTVLTSIVSGDNGMVTFEVQQTSPLHSYFLGWSNDVDSAARLGDLTNAVAGVFSGSAITAQSTHVGIGGTLQKQPDKQYGAQAAMISWILMCSELISE